MNVRRTQLRDTFTFRHCTTFSDDYVDDEEDDMNCTNNEDELERAEMRLLQKQLVDEDLPAESKEEKDYKEEFFELLDEVLFLLGKSGT